MRHFSVLNQFLLLNRLLMFANRCRRFLERRFSDLATCLLLRNHAFSWLLLKPALIFIWFLFSQRLFSLHRRPNFALEVLNPSISGKRILRRAKNRMRRCCKRLRKLIRSRLLLLHRGWWRLLSEVLHHNCGRCLLDYFFFCG